MPTARPALRFALPIALFAALVAASPGAIAAPILLEDGVAFLEIDPTSPDGLTGWTVNGVAHVRTQSFWVGSGAGAEVPLSDFAVLSALASDGNADGHDDTLTVEYQEPSALYRMTLRWALSGSAIGDPAPASQLALDITLTPTDATAAIPPLRLFQYTDVDLFTSFADDAATFAGSPLAAQVTDSSGLGDYTSQWDRAPDAVDARLYDITLASLMDGGATVLSDSLAASGDVTLAAMWEFALTAGNPVSFGQLQTIRTVPEPGAALLIGLGLAGLGLRAKGKAR